MTLTRLLLIVAFWTITSFGQNRVPQFKDYPVSALSSGSNAPVVLKRDDRMYRTRLRDAAKEKPNFAGHYILTYWGCGTSCLVGAVIDANTGNVFWLPASLCCWDHLQQDDSFTPILFRLNSRLLILSGARNEKEEDEATHFYEFNNGRFRLIRSIKPAKMVER